MKQVKYLLLFFMLISPLFAQDDLVKVKLQLQWKHQFEFAGFYAAKEQGYYEDIGLDVEFLEYDKQKGIVNTVLKGEAEFGLTYSSLISEYLNDKPVVFIANYFKQSPLVIVAHKDIQTPIELYGKKVMGISDTIDSITLKLMLEKFGVSLNDIKNIPTTFNINDFVDKKVDAMTVFTTNEVYQLDKLGIDYNLFNPSIYGYEYYDVNLFTSSSYAKNNSKLIQQFKEASKRGWEYALLNKEEIVKLIQKKYNSQNKTKDALLFEAEQIEHLMFTRSESIGNIDPLRVQLIAKNFIEAGYAKHKSLNSLDNFIFNYKDFSANPSSVKTIQLTQDEKEFLRKHPKIVLGTGSSWEPYTIKRADGTIVGYDQDIIDMVNSLTGANFVLEQGNWSKMQVRAKTREVDGLATLTVKESRKEYLNFSDKYVSMVKNIYVKQGNPKQIYSLKDLEGKTISVHKGNLADEAFAKSIKNAKVIYSSTQLEMLKEVIYGEADATSGNGVTEYMMAKMGLPYLKNVFALNETQKLHFAIRNDWPEAISILNKALRAIPEDKKISLHLKWFRYIKNHTNNKIKLSPKEKYYLQNKKYITMCVDPDWEPYEQIDAEGKHIGLASDFIKLLEEKIDKDIKLIKTKTWTQSLAYAKNGKCEILSFVNQSAEREKYLNFTPSMYSEPEVIIAKDEVTYLDGFDALKTKTVGIVKGYRTDEYIKRNYPDIKIQYIKNNEEGIELVSNGQIDAAINSLLGTAYLIRKSHLHDIKIAGQTNLVNDYKIGILKEDKTLHSILSKAISSITQKDKDKILSNWISIKFEQQVDYELVFKIVGFSLFILLLLLYRQYSTKKQNRELEKKVKEQVAVIVEKDRMIFQQNKLASMGEMIENIAHQWRQPLAQINAAVMTIDDIVYDNGCLSKELEKELKDIERTTRYMSKTIDDFRRFVSKSDSEEVFLVEEVFNDCLSIISKPLEYNLITLEVDIDKTLELKGSSSEFMQVLMIIFNNSKEAIVSNTEIKGRIVIKGYKKNNKVIISICDNGGGIEEKIIEKIFEPYFTTKHKTEGTGLGLYISKMIVEGKLDGKLNMENKDGGACFFMEFDKMKEKN